MGQRPDLVPDLRAVLHRHHTFGLFFIGTIVDAIILPGMVERKNTSLARGGRLLV
jgi:hypothetical protein